MRGRGKKLRKKAAEANRTLEVSRVAYDQAIYTSMRPNLYFDLTDGPAGTGRYGYDKDGRWTRLS